MAPLKYHVLKEYANGVMDERGRFFPFQIVNTTGASVLPARDGKRYFLKSAVMACIAPAATAAGTGYASCTIHGTAVPFMQVRTFATPAGDANNASMSQTNSDIGVLTDLNTAITQTINVITTCGISLVYAEIDEKEGEYAG